MASTDLMSGKDLQIFWSSDDSTWTDVSGEFNSIPSPEAARDIGEAWCFEDDYPTPIAGKKPLVEVEFAFLYTEVSGESFMSLEPYFADGSDVYISWYPKGSGAGSSYTTQGIISSFAYPGGEADSSDPIICSMTVTGNEIEVA